MKASNTILVSVSLLALTAADAYAQQQNVIEEITITARKRAESYQDVPITVDAFSARDIKSAGIERPRDFINLIPNVNLVETQNEGNAFVVIRGISQARNSEPSVALVIDGVQVTQPAAFNQELFDIQSIQVLKGPQGALYGRNAIGGAIIIDTKAPSNEFEGSATVGVDNGFGYRGLVDVSGPLTDNLKYRAAVSYKNTDGYLENTYLNQKADPYEDLSGRARFVWDATDSATLDLRVSGSRTDTRGYYFNIVGQRDLFGNLTDPASESADDTSLPIRVNNPGDNLRHIYDVSLKADVDYDFGTITSVSSYNYLDEITTGDAYNFLPIQQSFFYNLFNFLLGEGNGFDLNQSQYLEVKTVSQELRFTSPSEKRLRYVFGGYVVGTKRFISTGNMIDTGQGVFPVYKTPSTNPANPQFTYLADSQSNFAWSLFGDLEYDVTDQLEASASIRYDHDHRYNVTDTPQAFLDGSGIPAFTGQRRSHTWAEAQPKFTLTYKPSDMLTIYGGWSRGFRSGGFNQTGVGSAAASAAIVGVNDLFDKEVADTWEIGMKGQFAQKRLSINASAYSTTTKGSYFFVFLASNSTQNLGNIGKERLKGFEIEATALPIPELQLNASFGYTDSEIKEFPDPTVIGNQAPLVSRTTLNLGAQYTKQIGSSGMDIVGRIDYRRIGRTWWEPYNTTSRSPVNLVDVRLGVESGNWSLTAWSKNLFDEKYNAEFSPGGFVFKALPRQYGIDLSTTF